MACSKKITDDILYDCVDLPKKGLSGSAGVLINYDDIDWSATVKSGSVITNLALNSGATGYAIQWYKDIASANSSYNKDTENEDGFLQNFVCRLATSTAENAERANELKQGRFIVVLKTKYLGTDEEDAFKALGFDAGLTLSEMAFDTSENSGGITFTLGTEDGDIEKYPYMIVLETNYDTTQTDFDALFVTA